MGTASPPIPPRPKPLRLRVKDLSLNSASREALHCPGLPDLFVDDGTRVGWLMREVLWILEAGRILVLSPEARILAVAAEGEAWTLLTEFFLWRGDPRTGEGLAVPLDMDPEAASHVGASWTVIAESEGRRVLGDGPLFESPRLPEAARKSSLLVPWARGAGVLWMDDTTLYRMARGERPVALGNLSFRLDALASGPHGAAILQGPDELLAVAPAREGVARRGDLLVPVEDPVDLSLLRFSSDGRSAVAPSPGGMVLIDLESGRTTRRWEESWLPVGFAGAPLFLDEEAGRLLDGEGRLVLEGFVPSGSSRRGLLLAGPGGRLHDLADGTKVECVPPFTSDHCLLGTRGLLLLDPAGARLLSLQGHLIARWPLPAMPAPGASSLPSSADRDEDTPVEIEALAWAGPSSVLVLGDDGSAMTLDLADGSVLDAKCLDISEDAQEWPTLLLPSPWEASGETDDAQFALRDGDDALLLPSGARVNADGEIPACAALSKRAFFRALLERVEAFQLSDGARLWWADGIEARAMAASRHLFLLERDDLIVLDGSTGDARARFPGLAEDCDRVEVLDGRSLALLSTREEAPLIRVVDANRGQVLAEAALPCDGVARVGDTIWVWTDDGTLLRLGLAR